MNTHRLKIHQQPFDELLSGAKNNEVRYCGDRTFAIGDQVMLIEIAEGLPTGRSDYRIITHIQRGYGLPGDLCVLSYADRKTAGLAARVAELEALINTPHTDDWFEGVRLEAAHQIERWGASHDAGKGPANWFWLLGYLGQKAMTAAMTGDEAKARHHIISSAAMLLNWFRAFTGDSQTMRPGLGDEVAK